MRGLIYMRLNDFGQAEDSFRRAVALNPGDSNVQHNYGWLLCQQGRYDDAQRAFDAAMSNNQYGDGAKTLMTQGLCQAKAGRMAEAERSLHAPTRWMRATPLPATTFPTCCTSAASCSGPSSISGA
jgi:type IV pilus assembly protein PilF